MLGRLSNARLAGVGPVQMRTYLKTEYQLRIDEESTEYVFVG